MKNNNLRYILLSLSVATSINVSAADKVPLLVPSGVDPALSGNNFRLPIGSASQVNGITDGNDGNNEDNFPSAGSSNSALIVDVNDKDYIEEVPELKEAKITFLPSSLMGYVDQSRVSHEDGYPFDFLVDGQLTPTYRETAMFNSYNLLGRHLDFTLDESAIMTFQGGYNSTNSSVRNTSLMIKTLDGSPMKDYRGRVINEDGRLGFNVNHHDGTYDRKLSSIYTPLAAGDYTIRFPDNFTPIDMFPVQAAIEEMYTELPKPVADTPIRIDSVGTGNNFNSYSSSYILTDGSTSTLNGVIVVNQHSKYIDFTLLKGGNINLYASTTNEHLSTNISITALDVNNLYDKFGRAITNENNMLFRFDSDKEVATLPTTLKEGKYRIYMPEDAVETIYITEIAFEEGPENPYNEGSSRLDILNLDTEVKGQGPLISFYKLRDNETSNNPYYRLLDFDPVSEVYTVKNHETARLKVSLFSSFTNISDEARNDNFDTGVIVKDEQGNLVAEGKAVYASGKFTFISEPIPAGIYTISRETISSGEPSRMLITELGALNP